MSDDMGNVESNYFQLGEPASAKLARISERAKVRGGEKLLNELIERWEEKVAFYASVDSVEIDVEASPETHLKMLYAHRFARDVIKAELDYLIHLKEQYL